MKVGNDTYTSMKVVQKQRNTIDQHILMQSLFFSFH